MNQSITFLCMKDINEAASVWVSIMPATKHCIIPTQKLPSDLWAHQNIFTPTIQLKFSQLHMMIKPVQYAAETRAFFARALSELRFLVSRVRSWQCLSTCASIRLCFCPCVLDGSHRGPICVQWGCFSAKPLWCHLPRVASSFEGTPRLTEISAHTNFCSLSTQPVC